MLVRFAPSPTGYLHLGNARTAILNYLFSCKNNGKFILRLDDTDRMRSTDIYQKAIQEDLERLQIRWDYYFKQSERSDLYIRAINVLKKNDRLYPCFETEEELEHKRKIQLENGLPPIYDRESLHVEMKPSWRNRKPYYRFRLLDQLVSWDDLKKGKIQVQAKHLSDPVLMRDDETFLYTLTSVVDDGLMGVTHIIRGEDHISNTAIQIQLFNALGYALPVFAHMPLLLGAGRELLSKRMSVLSVRKLLQSLESRAIVLYLVYLGTSESPSGTETWNDLLEFFNLEHYGKSPAVVDDSELLSINQKVLSHTPFHEIQDRLSREVPECFWKMVRGNLSVFSDVEKWISICFDEHFTGFCLESDQAFIQKAGSLLFEHPTESEYQSWISKCKKIDGRYGKKLFLPLRRALTGQDDGPDLQSLVITMGPLARKRLLSC